MRLFVSPFFLVVAVSIAAFGCNGDSEETDAPEFETLFPSDGEIGSWQEDTSLGEAGVQTATTPDESYAIINGSDDPFEERDFVAFGQEHYTDDTYSLLLWIVELPDAATTKELYEGVITELGNTYASKTWQDISLGEAGRIADTGSSWVFNTRKGAYFVEAAGPAPNDEAAKSAGETFLGGVLAKIPN